jgi:hypothetical protein
VHGRLVTPTDRSETELFSELSPGKQSKIVFDLVSDIVGQGGLITIPQERWEGMDTIRRAEIAKHLKDRHVVALTAECSEAENLTVENFELE